MNSTAYPRTARPEAARGNSVQTNPHQTVATPSRTVSGNLADASGLPPSMTLFARPAGWARLDELPKRGMPEWDSPLSG